ncbi:hypothetical protein [Bacillus sp. FJAT-45037]|uniref:hypothetical protein n=1 Tax=Bacillus sp. FJAT-45037 TaxID=2011007 RepID=UPI000C236E40|nr:hypothetical protein [Bacillus sp. FJAT-45037]
MNHTQEMQMLCEQYMNQAVHTQLNGQPGYNGVVEYVDNEHLYLMVPVDDNGQYMDMAYMMNEMNGMQPFEQMQPSMDRQYYPYYPYYQQPFYYPYYGYGRPRRWNRLILPLAALTAIALL